MDGLNKMCAFSAVIKPALGNIISGGGVMEQQLRSIGFILILYSLAPNIIHEMTLAQKIMFVLGASWLFYEGDRK